jgi:hypothetical protein
VARLNPEVTVGARYQDLVTGIGLGELADAGAVIGCLDSVRARLQLLGRCALVGAPLVDGGTHPWGGEVRLRLDPAEPCYGCTLTPSERAVSDLPWSCADLQPHRPASSSIVGTAIVAGWMTLDALRILLGAPPPYRLLAMDGATGATAVSLTRDPACPFHRPLPGPVEPVPVRSTDPVVALLDLVPAGTVPLGWVPFPARVDPLVGAGAVHRTGEATRGAGRPQPRQRRGDAQTLSLREADPDLPLRDLGIAPEEILAVLLAEGGYRWIRLAG